MTVTARERERERDRVTWMLGVRALPRSAAARRALHRPNSSGAPSRRLPPASPLSQNLKTWCQEQNERGANSFLSFAFLYLLFIFFS